MSARVTAREKRDAKKTFDELARRGRPQRLGDDGANVEVHIRHSNGDVEVIKGYLASSTMTHESGRTLSKCDLEIQVTEREIK